MPIIDECCGGLDVHKKCIVAYLLSDHVAGQRHPEVCTFGTMTLNLLALADWL
jgi:hypothetical protein